MINQHSVDGPRMVLYISPSPDGLAVSLRPPGGAPGGAPPGTPLKTALRLPPLDSVLRRASQPTFHEAVGRDLFRALFPGALSDLYRQSFTAAVAAGHMLTLELCFAPGTGDAAKYPWELLHDGARFVLPATVTAPEADALTRPEAEAVTAPEPATVTPPEPDILDLLREADLLTTTEPGALADLSDTGEHAAVQDDLARLQVLLDAEAEDGDLPDVEEMMGVRVPVEYTRLRTTEIPVLVASNRQVWFILVVGLLIFLLLVLSLLLLLLAAPQ